MRFIAISNYLRVLIFAILLSFAEIAEINTRKNMSPYPFPWQSVVEITTTVTNRYDEVL